MRMRGEEKEERAEVVGVKEKVMMMIMVIMAMIKSS